MLIQSPRKTTFITFYSFKGGVGRTMALVNAACILAGRGRRVLMIDFDLEAPGLTTLRDFAKKTKEQQAGLVELVQDFLTDPIHSALTDKENKTRFHDQYVCQLDIPKDLKKTDTGCLDLLPCGRQDDTYLKRLNDIDFRQLYSEGIGQPLFNLLKRVIQESELYDYVLVDSRTGLSDEGGICTRDLADHVMVIMGLNRQNVDGTVQFLQRLKASNWDNGEVVFVASPVPVGYEELRDKRLKAARSAIKKEGFSTDFKLRVPYHPRLALDEEPFIYRWSDTDIFAAYINIEVELRQLASDTPEHIRQSIRADFKEKKYEQALAKLHQLKIDAPDLATSLLLDITAELIDLKIPPLGQGSLFFEMLINIQNDAESRRRYGEFLLARGDYKQSMQFLVMSHNLAIKRKDYNTSTRTKFDIGRLYLYKGNYKQAYELITSVHKYDTFMADSAKVIYDLFWIGTIHFILDDLPKADHPFEEAQSLLKNTNDPLFPILISRGDGLIMARIGMIDVGIQMIAEANGALLDLNNILHLSAGYMDYDTVLFWKGNYQEALNSLEQHWRFIQTNAWAHTQMEAYVLRAKLKFNLGNMQGAVEDAKVALEFYQRNEAHPVAAKEAAEIVARAEANASLLAS